MRLSCYGSVYSHKRDSRCAAVIYSHLPRLPVRPPTPISTSVHTTTAFRRHSPLLASKLSHVHGDALRVSPCAPQPAERAASCCHPLPQLKYHLRNTLAPHARIRTRKPRASFHAPAQSHSKRRFGAHAYKPQLSFRDSASKGAPTIHCCSGPSGKINYSADYFGQPSRCRT
eukprot:IDg11711t1